MRRARHADRVRAARGVLVAVTVSVVTAGGDVHAQTPPRPQPDLYHWVLPVDTTGVDVATLHPNDCYAVRRATGSAFFGPVTPALTELQPQLGLPSSHRVKGQTPDPTGDVECSVAGCVDVERLAPEIEAAVSQVLEDGEQTTDPSAGRSAQARWVRRVDHRPSPFDQWFGGAYTDVGSDDRSRFRNTPEQRMLFQHLSTSRRGNCYEAKAHRTLSIHVRDQQTSRPRIGVYRGYLYVEHHHATAGHRVAN